MTRASGFRLWLLLCLGALLPACSLLAGTDKGDLGNPSGDVDGGTDSGPIPCPTDCDDDNVCTVDACSDLGMCTHASTCGDGEICDATAGCVTRACENSAECDNGLACDGEEMCDPGAPGADATTGCVDGAVLDCSDDFSCTVDTCDEGAGGCKNAPDNDACSDGVDCTTDVCDPDDNGADDDGCVRAADDSLCQSTCYPNATCNVGMGLCNYGAPLACGDSNDECAVNTCDPAMDMCVSMPVDADMDGHTPEGCGGGDDCDDNDASVYPGADEVCDNGKDDDCDGDTDEDDCTTVPDKCSSATAIEIQGDGPTTVTQELEKLNADGTTLCDNGSGGGVDAVYYVDVPSSRDLEVTTAGSDVDTILAVQDQNNGCSDSGWGFACNDDVALSNTDARVWVQGTFFGVRRVYILVKAKSGDGDDEIKVTVRLRPVGVLTCGSPAIPDLSEGGSYVGRMPGVGLYRGSCQGGGNMNRGTEAVVRFSRPTSGAVGLFAIAAFKPFLYVRSGDCANGSEYDCDEGSPQGPVNLANLTVNAAAGTTYYAFVDAGRNANPFTLMLLKP